jgi:hypothetical protein
MRDTHDIFFKAQPGFFIRHIMRIIYIMFSDENMPGRVGEI